MAIIDITNQCNLACVYCCRGGLDSRKRQEPSISEICRIVDEMIQIHTSFVVFQGGEPLFRKDAAELLSEVGKLRKNLNVSFDFMKEMREILQKNLSANDFRFHYKLLLVKARLPLFYVTTNGMIYSEELHSALKQGQFILDISLDAADPKINSQTRVGSDFEKIVRNIKSYARDIPVQISCTITESNVDYLPEMIKLAYECNCISVKFSPVIMVGNRKDGDIAFQEKYLRQVDALLDIFPQYSEKMFLNFKIYPHYRQHEYGQYVYDRLNNTSNIVVEYHECAAAKMIKEIYVDTNLDVYGCASMKGTKEAIIGNLHDTTIKEIWNSNSRKEICHSLETFENQACNYGGCVGAAFCHQFH